MLFNSIVEEAKEEEKLGEKQDIIKIDINMLNNGVDKNIISRYTDLSIKEIEKATV